jgi:predicted CoA-substrate-specific enzyme activase
MKVCSEGGKMYVAGVDVGSLSTDTVILDGERNIVNYNVLFTGASSRRAARRSYEEALCAAGLREEDISFIVSTGYGREVVPFAHTQVTEISCHARGAHFLFPGTRTVIDVGGQDSKAIRVNAQGQVVDFAMNEKCAAGTGRFLEVMARALEIELEEMGERSLRARKPVSISSMCTVFAESEVVSRIAEGHPIEDIIAGIHNAISDRLISLLQRVRMEEEVTMSGGVAKNVGVVEALQEKLGTKFNIAFEPQIVGAVGAALVALEKVTS